MLLDFRAAGSAARTAEKAKTCEVNLQCPCCWPEHVLHGGQRARGRTL